MRADLNLGGHRATNAADGVADTDLATVGQINGAGAIPLGAVIDYGGATPPPGFLFPYGQAVSRATYAALFAIIGTTFGAGDGSTTFNLPDYRGRVGAGKDDMGGVAASRLTTAGSGINGIVLGAAGGEQAHTLTTAEMPSHSHTVIDPGHYHSGASAGTADVPTGTGRTIDTAASANTGTAVTGITIASTGGGAAHNNVQPTVIVGKIMRVS